MIFLPLSCMLHYPHLSDSWFVKISSASLLHACTIHLSQLSGLWRIVLLSCMLHYPPLSDIWLVKDSFTLLHAALSTSLRYPRLVQDSFTSLACCTIHLSPHEKGSFTLLHAALSTSKGDSFTFSLITSHCSLLSHFLRAGACEGYFYLSPACCTIHLSQIAVIWRIFLPLSCILSSTRYAF